MLYRCLTTTATNAAAASGAVGAATCCSSCSSSSNSSTSSMSIFTRTPLLRRPQTMKTNPFVTEPSHFDRSFEKMAGTVQARMPQWKLQAPQGRVHDHIFGEFTEQDKRARAEDEMHGRKREKPAAVEARTFFHADDDSAAARLTRSSRLKAAQNLVHPSLDKNFWRTASESSEYYYPQLSLAQKRRRMLRLGTLWSCVGVVGWVGLRRLGHYMRYSG